MNEETQKNIFNFLLKNGITDYLGVPDSTLKYFISEGIQKKKILITTREEEAIGIATGIALSKHLPLVFMQNAGFGNCISTITSLVQLYKIPIIFLIGWRGYLSTDAPEHIKLGKIQPDLLKILGLNSRIITEKNWKNCCKWSINESKKGRTCALIIRREFHD